MWDPPSPTALVPPPCLDSDRCACVRTRLSVVQIRIMNHAEGCV